VFQHDPRSAARERDLGLRKIGRMTWRAGLAGAACSAVIALALGQHAPAAASTGGTGGASGSGSNVTREHDDQGTIVIPAQPPQSAVGPGHVASGGS
jgi:hypothetical protein